MLALLCVLALLQNYQHISDPAMWCDRVLIGECAAATGSAGSRNKSVLGLQLLLIGRIDMQAQAIKTNASLADVVRVAVDILGVARTPSEASRHRTLGIWKHGLQ